MLLKGITDADISVCGFASAVQRMQPAEAVYYGTDALRALLDEKLNNHVWNKLYRRELFDGLLFPEGRNYEDTAVMHRIVDRAKAVAAVSGVKYHYQSRQESISKTYTAENLIDYADARLGRYFFFRDEHQDLFEEKNEELLLLAANGVSKVWRWWHGCKAEEKKEYEEKISSLLSFSKESIYRCSVFVHGRSL